MVPMCPECGSDQSRIYDGPDIDHTCNGCGHEWIEPDWGHYAPYVHATDCTECEFFGRGDPLVDGVAAVAQELRRFAGDEDWEFDDGSLADSTSKPGHTRTTARSRRTTDEHPGRQIYDSRARGL
jgi:hypothetical protein